MCRERAVKYGERKRGVRGVEALLIVVQQQAGASRRVAVLVAASGKRCYRGSRGWDAAEV